MASVWIIILVHLACRDGDVQSLTNYVGLRRDKRYLTEEDNFYFWTPLHFASFFGQVSGNRVFRINLTVNLFYHKNSISYLTSLTVGCTLEE